MQASDLHINKRRKKATCSFATIDERGEERKREGGEGREEFVFSACLDFVALVLFLCFFLCFVDGLQRRCVCLFLEARLYSVVFFSPCGVQVFPGSLLLLLFPSFLFDR